MKNFLMLLVVSLAPMLAHAQYSSDFTCSPDYTGFEWLNTTDSLYKYCQSSGSPIVFADRIWTTANFAAAKGSATGTITNSALGCTSATTITVSGAVVGGGVNMAWTGSGAVPSGIIPVAQITSANTVTYSACSVITLSVASRAFIINLL